MKRHGDFDSLLRRRLLERLSTHAVRATPQALESLLASLVRTPGEIVGDTDSLLLGLLYSGSYTVDLLEEAGVDLRTLRDRAEDSVHWAADLVVVDPVETLFSSSSESMTRLLRAARDENDGVLETSHILKEAVQPRGEWASGLLSDRELDEEWISYRLKGAPDSWGEIGDVFPIELRQSPPPSSPLLRTIETGVCDLLVYLLSAFARGVWATGPRAYLSARAARLTDDERWLLDKHCGPNYRDMPNEELEFIENAYDAWFAQRRILIDPDGVCLSVLNRTSSFLFGPKLFASSGGSPVRLEAGLGLAARYSPERDLQGLAMFAREGRVLVGQYTYRNSLAVESGAVAGHPLARCSIDLVRPTTLLPAHRIDEFTALINRRDVQERQIQRFLFENPEFLLSLGYDDIRYEVVFHDDRGRRLIPDFLLRLPGRTALDILDVKLPSARLTARQPYLRMSSELSKAKAQLLKYESYFESATNRREFQRLFGMSAFKPELIVLIGRSQDLQGEEERRDVERQLGSIRLVTFDDLIGYASRRALRLP